MVRADFTKLIEVCKTDLDESRFFLQTDETEKHYGFAFAKVQLKGTECLEDFSKNVPIQHGVFVDIWPVDSLPRSTGRGKVYGKLCQNVIKKLFYVRIKKPGYMPWYAVPLHYLLSIFSTKTWVNISERMYKRYTYEAAENCMSVMLPCVSKEWFSETIPADFEDRKFCIPKAYDPILKTIYGDYMTLPPEDKRGSNHTLEAY